jgi:hypothetical protein
MVTTLGGKPTFSPRVPYLFNLVAQIFNLLTTDREAIFRFWGIKLVEGLGSQSQNCILPVFLHPPKAWGTGRHQTAPKYENA